MIDSVLKGTGNSRFLKSAVPAGTSWADALAMLQAGTFPIDFNGINTEGFQQVGTPLNKANLLKDATAAQIGLPPSTTPDGMFRALGNAGELHVWRKTVKNAEDIPAGYTLGEVQNVTKYPITDVRSGGYTIVTKAYSKLIVDDAGNVSVDESSYVNFYDDASAVRGKFIQVYSDGDIIFIPNDANISTDYETVGSVVIHNHYTDKYQSVNAYPLTPAGTTTTYPVSTNPNAYQGGSDAKPAGYTLGATQKNVQILSGGDNWHTTLYYSDSVVVDDEGKLSLRSPNSYTFTTSSQYQNVSTFAIGRFIKIVPESGSGFSFMDGIWFVPSDSTIAVENFKLYASKIQPVTGYAAIPAGTTIEYLGKLGDKARVQVLSYVGTGTYGSSNPNSLTFDFVPKMVHIHRKAKNENDYYFCDFFLFYGIESDLTTTYGSGWNTINWNAKTVSWYSTENAQQQMNHSGEKFTAIAIG